MDTPEVLNTSMCRIKQEADLKGKVVLGKKLDITKSGDRRLGAK